MIRECVESISKVSQEDIRRVRALIDRDYGSFEDFLSQTGIQDYLTGVYNDSGNQTMDDMGIQGVFDLQNQGVIDALRDRTNLIIQSVDDTTKEDLSEMIASGVEDGQSWEQVAYNIRDNFTDIAPYRAELISRTETDNAYNMAQHDFFTKNGFQTHCWVTDGDPCEDCQANEDAGNIPIDESFPSGDDAPPLHPNCQCQEDTTDELPVDYEPDWTGE